MAHSLQILGFEQVQWYLKNRKTTGDKQVYTLKQKPDYSPYKAEVVLQGFSFWRNKPAEDYFGASHVALSMDKKRDPTTVNVSVQLRNKTNASKNEWSYKVLALVIYYAA
jgi:hypothetical protein